MSGNQKQKVRFPYIDMLKTICAFLVICVHMPYTGEFGSYVKTIAGIAVPVFFMITGFFYTNSIKKGYLPQIKKILLLLIWSNLIFFIYGLFISFLGSVGGIENIGIYLSELFTWQNTVKFLVFNESPFSEHLWYLGAILYVLIIAWIPDKLKKWNVLYP